MAGNEQANIATYKKAFAGSVPKDFTTPKPFKIVTMQVGAGINEYGQGQKISHPTPTDPEGSEKN